MKLKLLLLSHNVLLMAESYEHYIKLYYADGHSEIFNQTIHDYVRQRKSMRGYKNPVFINNVELFPTMNISYDQCLWVNLDYLEQGDNEYMTLLKKKRVLDKVKKMYISRKEKQISLL